MFALESKQCIQGDGFHFIQETSSKVYPDLASYLSVVRFLVPGHGSSASQEIPVRRRARSKEKHTAGNKPCFLPLLV
jgi:hypothetical protein